MSNRDYENYNRSYSSDSYHNNDSEGRYGQSSYDSYSDLEPGIKAELERRPGKENFGHSQNRFADYSKSKPSSKTPQYSCLFWIVVTIVIIGGMFVVFLPQINDMLRQMKVSKNNDYWFPKIKKEAAKKAPAKSQSESEAEKFGLQEQQYVALKGLSPDDILKKLEENSLKNEEKRFLAIRAIGTDDADCLKKIIKSGISIDTTDDNGASLLYIAVRNNDQKCMKFLIDSGANIKAETKDGDTILHAAAYNGNFDVVKTAIMAGIPVDKLGSGKKTPLYRAAQANQGHICRMLVLAGAQRLPKYSNVTEDLDLKHFFQTGKGYWSPTTNSNTKSKFRGNQGPDREEEEKAKWIKVSRIISEGRLSDLLKEVPNPKDFENMSAYGLPPVCVAAKSGQIEMLKYLQRIGCSMQEIDSDSGKSALHFGAQSGNEEVVDYLLANTYINVNMQDDFNNTALHYSILAPLPYATIRLLKEGANPDIRNLRLQTPLHMAVEKNNILGCKLLIENGANINQQDYAGNTAFHYAAMKSNSKGMLDVFYDHMGELDTSIKNNEGKTARESQRWDYLKYYEEHYR